jgi:hypothetical protein
MPVCLFSALHVFLFILFSSSRDQFDTPPPTPGSQINQAASGFASQNYTRADSGNARQRETEPQFSL